MEKRFLLMVLCFFVVFAVVSCKNSSGELENNDADINSDESNTSNESDECEHSWKIVTIVPSCTSGGCQMKICNMCGKSFVESEIEPLLHTYIDEYLLDEEHHWQKCSKCDFVNNKDVHDFSDGYTCLICGTTNPNISYSTGLEFTSNGDDTCYVSGIGTCVDEDIMIPPISPEGDKVIGIGEHAFNYCDKITSVIMPDGVITIGYCAFNYCKSLTNIEIPSGVESIDWCVFNNCSSLTYLFIPDSVIYIGDYVFEGCTSLSGIYVSKQNENYMDIDGNLYTKDGKELIKYASGKEDTTFVIPKGVSTILRSAVAFSKSLVFVEIPESLTNIHQQAFEGCTSLTTVLIPNSVTSIDCWAFNGCTALTSAVIGNGLTIIGEGAFLGCDSLVNIYYVGSQEEWNGIFVESDNDSINNATIHFDRISE